MIAPQSPMPDVRSPVLGQTPRVAGMAEFKDAISRIVDFGRLTLSLEIVAACSLRCPGCWVAKARPDMWTAAPGELMPSQIFAAALTLGRYLGVARLQLLGGEPTMHPNLPGVVSNAIRRGYSVSVTTNGVTSMSRLEGVLRSGIDGISFSIDGSRAEIHDRLRPSPGGKSTFEITLRSLRRAVALRPCHGYKVTVNHTIYPQNLDNAEAMIELSASLGVDRIRLHSTLPGDYPRSDGRIAYLDPVRWLALHDRLPGISRRLGVPVTAARLYGHDVVAEARTKKSPYLNIQPDGSIQACAAYARLRPAGRHMVACLMPPLGIILNERFPWPESSKPAVCCGAIPRLLESLPVAVRETIEQAGGCGCMLQAGPLLIS